MSIFKPKSKTNIGVAALVAAAIVGLIMTGNTAAQAETMLMAGVPFRRVPAEETPTKMTPLESVTVPINLTNEIGVGEAVGTVTLADTQYGLLLTPNLMDLPPGIHGFHIHQNAACGPSEKDGKVVPGLAAGGHYDPAETGSHEGPYAEGHLGDLPPLYVDMEGNASTPVLAPRLTMAEATDHALMVHMDGDNFSDVPAALGGGGARLACGVVE
ncbi:MAG: superoxide dismutase [Cu-Zn] SodC [Phormidesmis sp.]